MSSDYTFRQATPADIPFLVICVLQAERVNTASTYQQIFSLSLSETQKLIQTIFEEDCSEQEICASQFLVIEYAGKLIGGCSAWIEPTDLSSAHLKAQLLAFSLGNEKFQEAIPVLKLFTYCQIPRTPGSLQLESFYIDPNFRGQNIIQKLIENQIAIFTNQSCNTAEIQLTNNNIRALKAYQKCGFAQDFESNTDDRLIPYLGANGKIRLTQKLNMV